MQTLTQTFVTSDGVRLAYGIDDFTDPWRAAETAILLHAGMGSSARWYAMVPPIARHYRTVRLDMRGHGQSQLPPEELELSLARLTQDVRELMDHLALRDAHFICNATGGYLGQHLAARSPERVKSLVLFSSTPGQKFSGSAAWIAKIERDGLRAFLDSVVADRLPLDRVDPGYVRWYVDETAKNDTAFILRILRLLAQLDLSAALPEIRCPTLLVVPGARYTPGGPYAVMANTIPDVTMIYHQGDPQSLCDTFPERSAKEALDFLRRRFGHSST